MSDFCECGAVADLIYLGVGMCDHHWLKHCQRGPKMLNLKKKPKPGWCAAMRCCEPAVETHHLDEDLQFCVKHAAVAAKEYGEDPPQITKLGVLEPTPEAVPEALTPAPTKNPEQELQVQHQEHQEALALVQAFEIENQDDVAFAEESRAETKGEWKRYETKRTSATKPFNEGLREVNSWFKPVLSTLKEIELAWNGKLKAFKVHQARVQEAWIQAARTADKPEKIKEALVAASEAPMQTQVTTFIDRWVFEVTDPALVPAEFLSPDLKKIGLQVGQYKGASDIPGVRVWNDPIVRGPSK